MSNYSPTSGAQTFTSFAPSSDLYSLLMKELNMDGNELRKLLQTPAGSEIVRKKAQQQIDIALKKDHVKNKPCTGNESECDEGQICGTFKPQSISGGTDYYGLRCQNAVFPELNFSKHVTKKFPVRPPEFKCLKDEDCKIKFDKWGKTNVPSVYDGSSSSTITNHMGCNYNWSKSKEKQPYGKCQMTYNCNDKKVFLKKPPEWDYSIEEPIIHCNNDQDCGYKDVDGWSRCIQHSDGKKYCVWPGLCPDVDNTSQKILQRQISNPPTSTTPPLGFE